MKPFLRASLAFGIVVWCVHNTTAQGIIAGQVSFAEREVTGEPYSATTEDELSRTLADGTHIHEEIAKTKRYRDSQGRTRVEQFFPAGTENPDAGKLMSVTILDPVARTGYWLNPRDHKARLMFSPTSPANKADADAAPPDRTSVTDGDHNAPSVTAPKPRPKPTVEDLGTQIMDGLTAKGTRTTRTIPEGAAGNDRPIEVVTENWFASDLGFELLSKTSDPRSGERIMRTTVESRSEPDLSLFQVPPDYTIEQR